MSTRRCPPGWNDLPVPERCRLVSALARRLAKDPPGSFASWGVVGVGAGWRVRESDHRRVIRGRTPVLALTVRRKQAKARIPAARLIPPSWPVTVGRGPARRVVQVPIDVCRDSLRARAHGPRVAPAGCNGREGTACVVLEDNAGARWLLGCHHVLGDSNVRHGLVPATNLSITVHGRTGAHQLDDERYFARLRAGWDDCIDAAVVRVKPADPVTDQDWGKYPYDTESDDAFWRSGAQLVTPRGLIELRFVSLLSNVSILYLSGARARLRELAIFEAVGRARPRPGDSGSPALSQRGDWIGMHVAGDGPWSYVIPAYLLLDPGVFGFDLYLSN